jgi:hypothetical protein
MSTSFIQAKEKRPPEDFKCDSVKRPNRIDLSIETGSKMFAGSGASISFLLRDSQGVACTLHHGPKARKGFTEAIPICCPENFAQRQ